MKDCRLLCHLMRCCWRCTCPACCRSTRSPTKEKIRPALRIVGLLLILNAFDFKVDFGLPISDPSYNTLVQRQIFTDCSLGAFGDFGGYYPRITEKKVGDAAGSHLLFIRESLRLGIRPRSKSRYPDWYGQKIITRRLYNGSASSKH